MREKIKLAFLIVGSVLLIVLFIMLIFYFKASREECINNPLVYGVGKYSEKTNLNLTCTCYFDDISYSPFFVTKDNITFKSPN